MLYEDTTVRGGVCPQRATEALQYPCNNQQPGGNPCEGRGLPTACHWGTALLV